MSELRTALIENDIVPVVLLDYPAISCRRQPRVRLVKADDVVREVCGSGDFVTFHRQGITVPIAGRGIRAGGPSCRGNQK